MIPFQPSLQVWALCGAMLAACVVGGPAAWRLRSVAPLLYALGGALIGAVVLSLLLINVFWALGVMFPDDGQIGRLVYVVYAIVLGVGLGGLLGAWHALWIWQRATPGERIVLALLLSASSAIAVFIGVGGEGWNALRRYLANEHG